MMHWFILKFQGILITIKSMNKHDDYCFSGYVFWNVQNKASFSHHSLEESWEKGMFCVTYVTGKTISEVTRSTYRGKKWLLDYRLSFPYFMIRSEEKMRLTSCFVIYTTAQFSCTNDLRSKNKRSEEVADSIVYLVRQIEYSCDATVTISELVCWRGKLDQAFNTANKLLIKFCHQNEWKLIRHQNITYNRLNKGGLHLHLKVTLTVPNKSDE